MGRALVTDFYELTMAASYVRRDMTAPATFSLFVRRLPPTRGFLVAAGLGECLDLLEGFRFEEKDLAYLATQGFADEVLQQFATLRFDGDVWAVPEGSLVFANEPLLEVTAPMPVAQLVESHLLNIVSFRTALASKAARCVLAAQGRFELVDFALRRTQGFEAGMAAARAATMVGFVTTSNVEAARLSGLPPSGTMAHSYIEAFATETEAFRAFAADFPERTTLLVDTYDTLRGVSRAITVIKDLGLEERAALRLDSGDLAALSHATRRLLDDAGLPRVKIVVSGNLDEHAIDHLVRDGAPVDVAGVGTRMGVSADAPALDTAYKLVAYAGRPVAKLSENKETFPGPKQVYRAEGLRDLLATREEPAPVGSVPLLVPVMRAGRRVSPPESLETQRARFGADRAQLPTDATRLADPVAPEPSISPALRRLTSEVRDLALAR